METCEQCEKNVRDKLAKCKKDNNCVDVGRSGDECPRPTPTGPGSNKCLDCEDQARNGIADCIAKRACP